MRAWLKILLDHLNTGLVPLDGDAGRHEAAPMEIAPCPEVHPARGDLHREAEEASWIPRAVLYGPPL
jgi:hypothetical protein